MAIKNERGNVVLLSTKIQISYANEEALTLTPKHYDLERDSRICEINNFYEKY